MKHSFFVSDQHVSLSITHIENEPSMQRIIAQMQNATETKCTAKISVIEFKCFLNSWLKVQNVSVLDS